MRYIVYITIFFIQFTFNVSVAEEANNIDPQYLLPSENDVVLGDKAAPITMIEYSSLSCPHCADFHKKTFEFLKSKYLDTGKLKYIHRNYPLDKAAYTGSVLVHCAGKDKYYLFLKILFEKQENWVFHKNYSELLENIGKLGGISGEKFQACLVNKQIEESILNSRLIAMNKLNVNATPTFFINGKAYTGVYDAKFFSNIIDKILANENKETLIKTKG
ncbi:MAG: DsbA family protein [Alphaproteobacteria bacterium]